MLKIDDIVDKIVVQESRGPENRSDFIVEPLYRGYGHTLGNSLRRILLSSVLGCAIKAVKIEGVVSEFANISGIKEDVVDILLNLKGVVLQANSTGEKSLKISVKGPAKVTAGDIKENAEVSVVNKHHVIAHITDKSTLEIELLVDTGRNYTPAEEHDKSSWSLGFLAIDSLFSPVRAVDYNVENTRVGRLTNFDKLTISLETNGSVAPKEIMSYAVELYINHLKPFLSIGNAMENLRLPAMEEMLQVESKVPNLKIEELDLSVRSYNCLKRSDINSLQDLLKLSQKELLSIKNLGKSSIAEITAKLEELGVKL